MENLKTPKERSDLIIQEWSGISNWEDRYKKIIELGKKLPAMPDEMKIEANQVRGCQSQVWIKTTKSADGLVVYQGDSDALLVRGLVALVLHIYSNSKPTDVLQTPPEFIKALGFETHLSPSRTNGLFSMIKRIMMDAMVLSKI